METRPSNDNFDCGEEKIAASETDLEQNKLPETDMGQERPLEAESPGSFKTEFLPPSSGDACDDSPNIPAPECIAENTESVEVSSGDIGKGPLRTSSGDNDHVTQGSTAPVANTETYKAANTEEPDHIENQGTSLPPENHHDRPDDPILPDFAIDDGKPVVSDTPCISCVARLCSWVPTDGKPDLCTYTENKTPVLASP